MGASMRSDQFGTGLAHKPPVSASPVYDQLFSGLYSSRGNADSRQARRLAPTSPPSAPDYFIIYDRTEAMLAASRARCSWPETVRILRGDAIQIATADNPLTPIPIANAIV